MLSRRRDITNIIALEKLSEKYRVTYDINDQMFIVHREVAGLPNPEFIMHDSCFHYYEPTNTDLVFLNNVSKNKGGFSKRQIKSAIKAWDLHPTLLFTSAKDAKWIIIIN